MRDRALRTLARASIYAVGSRSGCNPKIYQPGFRPLLSPAMLHRITGIPLRY